MVAIQTDDGTFTIDSGPPMLLSDGDNHWVIVTRPMLESFSSVSKRWYDTHPDIPERTRRLQAWLEDCLIDWLPLLSNETHDQLRTAICQVADGSYMPTVQACKKDSDNDEKLILRRSSQAKSDYTRVYLQQEQNTMTTFTLKYDHSQHSGDFDGDQNYSLQIDGENTKATFYNVGIQAALKMYNAEQQVVDIIQHIIDHCHPPPLEAIIYVQGKEEIQYGNATFALYQNMKLIELIANEKKQQASDSEDPTAVLVMMNAIETETEAKPGVYTKRVTKKDLPAKAWIQRGEIYGATIEWSAPIEADLLWGEVCNLNNEAGVLILNGGHGFGGFEPTQSIYLRYNQPLPGQEHCMRIIVKEGIAPLRQSKAKDSDIDALFASDDSGAETEPYPTEDEKSESESEDPIQSMLDESETEEDKAASDDESETEEDKAASDDESETEEVKATSDDESETKEDKAASDEFVQYLLQVWTRDNREKGDAPVNIIANSYKTLAEKFHVYAYGSRDEEDYMDDDEFEEEIVKQCAQIKAGKPNSCPELNIAFFMDCYVLPGEPDDAKKLNSTEAAADEDSFTDNEMVKNTNITVEEVAILFCDLGIGLASHFDLDTDEVIEYLDGVCEDTIGVNPDASEVFQHVKNMNDKDESDNDDDEVTQTITQSDFEEWFALPSKGGLKLTALKEKAQEFGMEISSKTKKNAIKDYLEDFVVPDDESESEVDESQHESESEVDESQHESESDDEDKLTTDQVECWFMPASKGGLKIGELRAKAKEFGLEVTAKTKRDEIKELMLELCEDNDNDDEEEDEPDLKELYLEAPGAKKNKFWKFVIEDCDMITTYGTVGNKGTTSTKSYKSNDAAIDAAAKLVKQKVAKGYFEPESGPNDEEPDTKNSGSDSEEECQYTYSKGPQEGTKCSTKPKNGAMFCGKHKDCAAAKKVSQSMSDDSEPETPKKKPKKNNKKNKGKVVKTKLASTGQCLYVGTRKPNEGKQCTIKPKDGEEFCGKHANTQQALNYNANDSPIAKNASKKLSQETDQEPKNKVVRDTKAKVWLIEGQNLVVKSPKNPTVYAYLTKKGTVNKKLNETAKVLAEELGLKIE